MPESMDAKVYRDNARSQLLFLTIKTNKYIKSTFKFSLLLNHLRGIAKYAYYYLSGYK